MDPDLYELLEIPGPRRDPSSPLAYIDPALREEIRTSLRRCRPLNDPVGSWARMLPWLLLMTICATLISMAIEIRMARPGESSEVVASGSAFLIFYAPFYWLMMRSMRITAMKPKILFLRAFSRDQQGDDEIALRNALRAALPPRYALAGIRRPLERSPSLFRAVNEAFIAMEYIGSNSFELEAADRNWFARLLSSATHAHAFVIDMRSLTRFVHHEIELATGMAVGPGRLFLIIDGSRSADEWIEELENAAKSTVVDRANLTLITVPSYLGEKRKKEFMKSAAASFAAIPDTPIEAQPAAWRKARSIVSDTDWPTPWRETPVAHFLRAGIPVAIVLLLVSHFLPIIGIVLNLISALIFYTLYSAAWVRLLRISRTQRSIGLWPRPGFISTLIFSPPVLILSMIGILVALTMPMIKKQQKAAEAVMMTSKFRQIALQLRKFSLDYGQYPSVKMESRVAANTQTKPREGLSSNIILGQLIRNDPSLTETNFSDRGEMDWSRPADDLSDSPDTLLAPGECVVSYVSGLSPSSNYSFPLIMYPMTGDGTRFDPEVLGGKAVILDNSGSVEFHDIRPDGTVREFEESMDEIRAEVPDAILLHPEKPKRGKGKGR